MVEPPCRNRPLVTGDSRIAGHVLERAVPPVAIEEVLEDPGDEQVDVTVVVIVRGRRTHGVPLTADTRPSRDV